MVFYRLIMELLPVSTPTNREQWAEVETKDLIKLLHELAQEARCDYSTQFIRDELRQRAHVAYFEEKDSD